MHDSRLLDLDLVVQICSDRVLIVGVQAGSDGSGGFGRGAAAGRRRSAASMAEDRQRRGFWGYRAPFGPGFGHGGSALNA